MGFSSAMLGQLEGLRERCGPTPWSFPWASMLSKVTRSAGCPFFTLGFAQMAEAISGVGLLMLADGDRKGLPLLCSKR